MPTYDHTCSNCGTTIELIKRIAERDNSAADVCPNCKNVGTLNRIVAAPLVAYSVSVGGGYGSRVPDGFRDVLAKVHSAPGARQTSSFL